jgi:hypothetical protein
MWRRWWVVRYGHGRHVTHGVRWLLVSALWISGVDVIFEFFFDIGND